MHNFRLAVRMMLRDLRAGQLHLLGLAIVVAVASLASVGFLADRVAGGLDREANQLLGGDLLLRADQPWPDAYRERAREQGLEVVDTALFTSMVSTESFSEMAGIKAVESGYPLRGSVRIAAGPGQPDRAVEKVPDRGEVWLDERLFSMLEVETGDRVELGMLQLRVAGMVTFESDRGANIFSFLPRAIFNIEDLDDSGLIMPGSRVSWRLHLAGSVPAVDAFERWAVPRLDSGQRVETVDNARPQVREALDQAQRFLRLAALLAVVLAAVAVGLSARRFMQRHLDACAVMRCLGARQSQLMAIIVGEFLIFGCLAAGVGVVLGWGAQFVFGSMLAELMQVQLPAPSWWPSLHGLLVGLALMVGFVLPQLLRLARVPTLRVLRRELGGGESRSVLAWLLGASALAGLILWIAGDLQLGLVVALAFSLALGVFALAAWLVLKALGRLRGQGSLRGGWRYGLVSIRRRTGASVIQISALGLGMMALLLLTLVRGDLLEHWKQTAPEDAPNRFVINIQSEQVEAVQAHFVDNGLPAPEILPMIRGRLVAINSAPVEPDDYESRRKRRLAEREFNLSYASQMPETARIVDGQWHGADRTPQFSVEQGLAETFELALGDRVRFDIAGREVEAPITSVRELEWDSMQVNFFFIAAEGMIEDMPTSLVSAFHLPPGAQQGFTTGLIRAFPNLSVIDVDAVLAQVESVLDKLVLVVQFVFGFALLAGLVVLYAALQSTHDERDYEFAVLRTLGARNRQVRQALLTEFTVLGGVAGVLAGCGATVIGWLLAVRVFEMSYVPAVWPTLVATSVGIVAVVLAGWLGTRGLLTRAPLASLRNAA